MDSTPTPDVPALDYLPLPSGTVPPQPTAIPAGSGASSSLSGATGGLLAPDVATPTPTPCSDIHCIEHVVIIMQENQTFDRLLGVRPVRPKLVA